MVRLAGIDRPIPVQEPAIDSVAVLPFETRAGSEGVDYVSEGVTEILTNSLASVEELRTVPRSLTSRYRGQAYDPLAVARELGVRAVITGTVAEQDDRVVIGVELTDVETVTQLWGHRYERSKNDLLFVQRELTDSILVALRPDAPLQQRDPVAQLRTDNPEVWDLYLRSHYLASQHSAENAMVAVEQANRAVELDPEFAPAWWAVSIAYDNASHLGFIPYHPAGERLREAAYRSIELEPRASRGRVELGYYYLSRALDFPAAEREFRRALELGPDDPEALAGLGKALTLTGRFEECAVPIRAALEIEPTNSTHQGFLVRCYLASRRYEEALAAAVANYELNPRRDSDSRELALLLMGRHEEAIALLLENLDAKTDPATNPTHAYYLAQAGRHAEARAILERLPPTLHWDRLANGMHPRYRELTNREAGWGASLDRARALALLGEVENGMTILEAVVAEKSGSIQWNVTPQWDMFHGNPRFERLWRSLDLDPNLGLPED